MEDLNKVKKLIVDMDDTITVTEKGDYEHSKPIQETIDLLKKYHAEGFQIVIHSSRQMRTYEGQVGKINANTLPTMIKWLNEHNVPFDEIIVATAVGRCHDLLESRGVDLLDGILMISLFALPNFIK